ncbi:MAG: tRNA-specific adenosine deaminase [Buchnera aphidicola (Periphyllus acericola)]|uniref:tRNA adenosine(34) deaminase TadA n=1 Tax=Buchnera aphidicola TaxID=9 RepID=UPI0030CB304F|nr:tRNA-specific adenosine deaminase [Buchnera aphidicola (Periphyllus acericola)]
MKKYNNNDKYWMKIALFFARIAFFQKEVPVGSILVKSEKIVGFGWNKIIQNNDPTGHSEIITLRNSGKFLKNYRLLKTSLYVTLEPCMMCLGAILHSRINKLIIGAKKNKIFKNILYKNNKILSSKRFKIKIVKNVLKNECSNLLKNFFLNKRKNTF